ncbi:hypothetical protein EMIT051CA3_30715 [Pseudomonas chlororaphis]
MPRTRSFLHRCRSGRHSLFYSPLYSGPSMEGQGGQRFIPPPEAPGVWKKQRPTVS